MCVHVPPARLTCAGMCCEQFYLGTTRLQLEHKGDSDHVVTNIANVVPAFGFVGIPVIAWLLDKKGYGVTLAVINLLGVLASIFQAMPSLYFQVRASTMGGCCCYGEPAPAAGRKMSGISACDLWKRYSTEWLQRTKDQEVATKPTYGT